MVLQEKITSQHFTRLVQNGQPPVIMQVIPALNSGGVEQGAIDMNAAVVKAGGVSIVVSSGGLRVHEITRAGGTHIELPVHSKNPFVMWANVRRLRKIIKDKNVSLVHAASRAPAWSAGKAVTGTTAAYVTSCHSAHKISGGLKRFYNSSITGGALVIAVSHFLAGYLENNYKIAAEKIRVIHRGVSLEKWHPNAVSPERLIALANHMRIPEGASVVMLPGRLSRIKGHKFLLDAVAKLGRKDVFCLFVGGDHGNEGYRMELEKLIVDMGMGDQARIVTDCKDIPAAYMIATVVVCPSLVPEGFGRTAVEAQAMGRPVIATDHGGSQETIIHRETGWLIPLKDVGAFAAALAEALDLDGEERAVLATRAMGHVAGNFTNARMAATTLDVYAEALAMKDAAQSVEQRAA